MARGLYRVYLYVVTIALAGFATFSLAYLLTELFGLTPLRGSSQAPTSAEITQSVILFVVMLVVVGGFGGLHYWLIRRDIAGDPHVNESGVRAFTLNLAQAIAILVAVNAGVLSLSQLGSYYGPDISAPLAGALAAAALAFALEWERRRATPTGGAALVFERLRRHGIPLILLSTVLPAVYSAVENTQRVIAQQANILACTPPGSEGKFQPGGPPPVYLPPCVGNEVYGAWAALALALIVWFGFLWLGRSDSRSLLRQVLLLIGWTGGGMVILAITLERAAEYVLRLLTPGADAPSYLDVYNGSAVYDFGPIFAMAAVALAVYGWALREREPDAPMSAHAVRLTMRALSGAVLAAPFWIGVFLVARNVIVSIAPAVTPPTPNEWDTAFAFVIAGVGYIPLALWLGAGSRAWEINGPRRGFVLALLAAGALVTAGSVATLLFVVVTPLLNVPLDNWQEIARNAGAALIAGAALGGLYLFIALRERQFIPAPKAPQAVPEAPEAPEAAEVAPSGSLDEALAQFKRGDISQEAAAERIRMLAREGALV
ncbi:MAG TPA: hypothetical protein VFQ25_06935 [Ktedonobacterales bacterium]|nr:hypothetical protein [Ktedonobacterales bacterium]